MKNDRTGKVQTVLGLIDSEEIGVTLPHEHLLIDQANWFNEPTEATFKKYAYDPVTLENLSWVRHNLVNNRDNLRLLDEKLAINEVMLFKKEGGKTIVDLTNYNLARDPLALARISRATDMHIVMGCGYYVANAQGPEFDKKTEDEIAEEIINDIENGVGNTGIHSGIIGEIGCSWPLDNRERKSLKAAAIAQKETGAPINIHPGSHIASPIEIVKILSDFGADISRVVISHMGSVIRPLSVRCELASTGCYLEYDAFGSEPFNPIELGARPRCCDRERVEQIMELIEKGYLKQILISHDVCTKTRTVNFGGNGYAHIQKNIIPRMITQEITYEQILTMMYDNPKDILQFTMKT